MMWSYLFGASVAHGIFILVIFFKRIPIQTTSAKLIITLIATLIITSLDYFLVSSKLFEIVPHLFGMSFGSMLLLGPLFYLYCRSVTDNYFTWSHAYWLHFLPYVINSFLQIPLYTAPVPIKLQIINAFSSGTLPFRTIDLILISFQSIHLMVYLILAIRYTKTKKQYLGNVQYLVSGVTRLRWITSLRLALVGFLICVVCLLVATAIQKHFVPHLNYSYTLMTCVILYLIAMRIVLHPEIMAPGFSKKYQNAKQFDDDDLIHLVEQIDLLFNKNKVFLDPKLKLSVLAKQLQVPAHQLSMVINEKFGKSFHEMVNQRRVEEFIRRVNDCQYANYSLYGIALDVGFTSKSSFNLTFKKVTGRTPSEYKSSVQ